MENLLLIIIEHVLPYEIFHNLIALNICLSSNFNLNNFLSNKKSLRKDNQEVIQK